MKAAVFHGAQDIRHVEIQEPTPRPGETLVEVEWCGLCGSDLHLYQLGPEHFGELCNGGEKRPFALGHEFCARVRTPAPGSKFKKGDPVFVDARLPCRKCVACGDGKDYACLDLGAYGYNYGGGLQEVVSVLDENLIPLPEAIPIEFAALIEPFAVAVHGIRMTGITDWSEQNVLVLGGGPVGLGLIMALRAYRPKKIVVSEPSFARRRQVADAVDLALNPLTDDVREECHTITRGRGIDVVFDCAGVQSALDEAVDVLKCEGIYLNVALWEKPMSLPPFACLSKHLRVQFVMIYDLEDVHETIRLFSQGSFKGYERMVTKRIGLRQVVVDGFEALIKDKDEHIKILVSPKF